VSRFLERLRTGPPLVADGGTGALISQAVPGLRCPEEANIRSPESVVAVHASYIAAGAELIETNTFGANRRKLARVLLDDAFEQVNSAGVRLAREAREVAGRDVFVAGAIGPLGELEVFDASEHGPLYAAQAQVLEGRGVDLFTIETFFDLEELVVAVEAVRAVSSLPIVALLTFDDEAEITGGVGAETAARRLAGLDVAAIGTNHGAGPTVALRALRGMRDAGIPLAALPNIGLASLAGGRVVYPHSTPEYFAEFALQAVDLGARIVGGCCGTTPAQIEAVREAFDAGRVARAAIEIDEPELAPRPSATEAETALARALRAGEWVVSVELDPPKGGSLDGLVETARAIRESGRVGYVDVNDNPMARARMNALMTSATLQREAGIETIPHVTPRDTTVMGLEGVLLGGDRRPAARRRLSRLARGVRGRLDRARAAARGAQPGRGLRRQGDRRPDLVLRGRGRQPVRGRPRARARPLPPQGRGGRTLRDDPGAVRPRPARPVRRAPRGVADPGPRRRLAPPQPHDGAAAPQRGARDQRSRHGARRARGRRRGRARDRPGARP
jgi:methionine synthase I (cobalamin-dependent)